jgi:GTP pyrophosphokinase
VIRLQLSNAEKANISACVERFQADIPRFEHLARQVHDYLADHEDLKGLVHSTKFRIKDPGSLRDKLARKTLEAKKKGKIFRVQPENLYLRITDLAGVRLLHLHTHQMEDIDRTLNRLLEAERYRIVEGPVAHTWDDEYSAYFKTLKIRTKPRPTLYTSVHYTVDPGARERRRCEIQVRTLAEELWGEVSHKINYPHETKSIACQEQLKTLARSASACTRLVSAIFASHSEYAQLKLKR